MVKMCLKVYCTISVAHCRGAVHQTGAGVQPRPHPMPTHRVWTIRHTAIRSPSVRYNGLHPCNSANCMDYYWFIDPRRMEGWVVCGELRCFFLPVRWSEAGGG